MSLAHLNRRLDQRFRLLTGGARTALPRQRTLRATMDWSFELLSRAEQATLARLSVFFGSFELEAAEAVCATAATPGDEVADIVGSLVNKSLVVAEHSSGTLRYGLLETVRQYGAERLRAYGGEAELHRARAAHADFYLQFVEQIGPEAIGPHQARILKRLDLEWDNVRAALAYFLAEPDRTDEVLRLGSALSYFLVTRWHRYGIDATRTALARNGPVSARAKAKALCRIGHAMARTLGWECEADLQAARLLMQQGLGIARDLGDEALTAEVLGYLSWSEHRLGYSAEAKANAEESLTSARNLGDDWLIGSGLAVLGLENPAPAEQRRLHLEAMAHLQRAGDAYLCIMQTWCLAGLELADGQFEAAYAIFQEATALAEEVGSAELVYLSWDGLGEARVYQARFEEALAWLKRSLAGFRRLGLRAAASVTFYKLACCATRMGDYCEAASLAGAWDTLRSAMIRGHDHSEGPSRFSRLTPLQVRIWEETRGQLRQALGNNDFELAYSAGARLTFDGAIELALGVTD